MMNAADKRRIKSVDRKTLDRFVAHKPIRAASRLKLIAEFEELGLDLPRPDPASLIEWLRCAPAALAAADAIGSSEATRDRLRALVGEITDRVREAIELACR